MPRFLAPNPSQRTGILWLALLLSSKRSYNAFLTSSSAFWIHKFTIFGNQVEGVGMAALKVGETAPDFELMAVTGKQRHQFKLSDYRGKKNVLLAFYPLDWSPT
jgi:hypothetical protein